MDNENLRKNSGSFDKTCTAMGATLQSWFLPTINAVMMCLMGQASFSTLTNFDVTDLFFASIFMESTQLLNYICINMLNKHTCVDILKALLMSKGESHMLTKLVLSYFRREFEINPLMAKRYAMDNPRQLRWDLLRLDDNDRALNRKAHFPYTCNICKLAQLEEDHYSFTNATIYLPCCLINAHIGCASKVFFEDKSKCPCCNFPYRKGIIKGGTSTELGVILEVGVVHTFGKPPPLEQVNDEIFKFMDTPLAYKRRPGNLRTTINTNPRRNSWTSDV